MPHGLVLGLVGILATSLVMGSVLQVQPHWQHGKLHPKFATPVAATGLTFFLYLLPALYSSAVIEWLYSAAYLWILKSGGV